MANDLVTRKPNPIDEKILQLAGNHSPEEISAALGGTVSPAKVASHLQVLLKQKDWLTVQQQEQLLMHRLQRILAQLEDQYLTLDSAKVILQYLKAIGDRWDKRAAATQINLESLYGNQARLMAQAIQLAFERALFELQKLHPEVDESEVRLVLGEALPRAIEVIEARNEGDAVE